MSINTKNIILIINYNHSADCGNKSFLDEIYSPHFKKVIHYSDNPKTSDPDINFIHTKHGWFSYGVLPHFYENYSELLETADGIFYTHDDCIINVNTLDQMDINKTMYDQGARKVIDGEFVPESSRKKRLSKWGWWKKPVGERNLMKFWKSEKWSGHPVHGFVGYGDYLYLPKKLFNEKFITILSDLYKHQVFLEIALPIAVNYINCDVSMKDSSKYNDTGNTKIVWDEPGQRYVNNHLFELLTEDNSTIVHPVKLRSNPGLKQVLRDVFNI